ncbi:hypothetical protein PT277_08690 [Acetobacteraceae bacterium ESL0709]|nr:hypothetical protein [Acetobacteraceae bacterium ESL0697]MDF7678759.1 hypothetical protein [Acetobacteraceae bacterium ESL0709]
MPSKDKNKSSSQKTETITVPVKKDGGMDHRALKNNDRTPAQKKGDKNRTQKK